MPENDLLFLQPLLRRLDELSTNFRISGIVEGCLKVSLDLKRFVFPVLDVLGEFLDEVPSTGRRILALHVGRT